MALIEIFQQGGFMMWPLLGLLVLTVGIVLERAWFFLRHGSWKPSQLEQAMRDLLKGSKARFSEEITEELERFQDNYVARLEKGLNLLSGIGNTAPILGFFGTVIGMIQAFASIAGADSVNAKIVAEGIQVALVTTAGGLAVAVPSLIGYHVYRHIILKVENHGAEVTEEIAAGRPYYSESTSVPGYHRDAETSRA